MNKNNKNQSVVGYIISIIGFLGFLALFIPISFIYESLVCLKKDYEEHLDTYQ